MPRNHIRRRMHVLRGEPKLFKRKRDGRYSAIFYDPDTRRRKWVSLETDTKAKAMRRFRRLVEAYEKGEFNPWRDNHEHKPPSLKEAAERFVQAKKDQGRRPSTLAGYSDFLSLMQSQLPAGLLLRDLQPEDCRKVIRGPKVKRTPDSEPGLKSAATQRTYYRTMNVFLRWCVKEGLIPDNPLDEVARPRAVKRPPAFLRRDDLAHLLQVMEACEKDDPDVPIVHRAARLAVSTGLRLGELLNVRCGDVDHASGMLFVRNREDFNTKSGHDRAVPLSPMALRVFDEVAGAERDPAEPLLKDVYSADWLSKRFKHYLRTAKLSDDLKFHSLRHTFCSWLAMDGVDPHRIKEWAGHQSLNTTEQYMHLAPERTQVVAQVFSGVQDTLKRKTVAML